MSAVPRRTLAAVAGVVTEYCSARYPVVPSVRSCPIPQVAKLPFRYAVSLVMTKRGANPFAHEEPYAPALEVRLWTAGVMVREAAWVRIPATMCQFEPRACLIRATAMRVWRSTPAYG